MFFEIYLPTRVQRVNAVFFFTESYSGAGRECCATWMSAWVAESVCDWAGRGGVGGRLAGWVIGWESVSGCLGKHMDGRVGVHVCG